MVPETPLERTEHGLVPASAGVASRHRVGVERETNDVREAYASFPEPRPARYRDGSLPDGG